MADKTRAGKKPTVSAMRKERQKHPPRDATYVAKGFYRGPRGAVLHSLTVSFEAKAKAAAWQHLIQQLRFVSDACVHGISAEFAALPTKIEELSPYLIGEVRLGAKNPTLAQWSFEWARTPNRRPPKELVTTSTAIGGFPTILKRLGKLWPTPNPLEMTVSATYFMMTDEWDVGVFFAKAPREQPDKPSPRLVPTHWRIEPTGGIIKEVILEPESEEDFIFLTGKGLYTSGWSSEFLNEVDGAVWSDLEALIKRR